MAQPISIEIDGIEACMRAFAGLESDLRRAANGELRTAAKGIGRDVVIPMLGGSGAPQEAGILAAAGPKSDRYVVVAVPNKKPRLSGLRRTPTGAAKAIGWAVESGSDYAPFRGPSSGSMVASHRDAMAARAVPRYLRALESIMRKHGLI